MTELSNHVCSQEGGTSSITNGKPAGSIVFPWLLRLRWGAVACLTLLIITVSIFLQIRLPIPIISSIIIFQALSNILLARLRAAVSTTAGPQSCAKINRAVAIIMFMDVSLLTLLIHYTGGPMNPFTFLYLVQIVVGSLIMRPRQSWALAIFTISCYAVLFFLPAAHIASLSQSQPICHLAQPTATTNTAMQLHLRGMWLAFAITSIFIVFFVSRIQEALDNYQQTISRLQKTRDNNQKLASLATLAAGAAHELSTPLAAIAVAAGEMQHSLQHDEQDGDREEILADTRFIKEQIKSCRDILYQMSSDAGQTMGEPLSHFNLAACLGDIIKEYDNKNLSLVPPDTEIMVSLPIKTCKRVIRSLINNSLAASRDNDRITISCNIDKELVNIIVRDQGHGMDAATLARASEPFFTTREPGQGMGLGLFLAKSVARRYGGDLELISDGGGTTAIWSFRRQESGNRRQEKS